MVREVNDVSRENYVRDRKTRMWARPRVIKKEEENEEADARNRSPVSARDSAGSKHSYLT